MYDHFQRIEVPITFDEFHRLPRNPAYKYEYFGGRAVLTPRPKTSLCVRDTVPFESPVTCELEPLLATEVQALEDLFLNSFRHTQPFASLREPAARACARDCLNRTVEWMCGPLVEAACVRAVGGSERTPIGAALVTLAHEDILTTPLAWEWKESRSDAVEKRIGCPHLTWVFVNPRMNRRGIGTALLGSVVRALNEMGYEHLASTFTLDNAPSALWHWRNGFRLLPQMSALDALRTEPEESEE